MQSLVFGFQKVRKTNYLKIDKIRCTFYDEMDLFFKQQYFLMLIVSRRTEKSKILRFHHVNVHISNICSSIFSYVFKEK